MSALTDGERLRDAFESVVRSLGLLRPDTTPCGQPMSITEAHAIGELRRRGPTTQNDLASTLGLQKSTVSRLVDQLEARDLAVRRPNPSDRRSVLVSLTPLGTDRADRLGDARSLLFASLVERLDAAEQRTVIDGLHRLAEAAREPV